MARRRRQPFPLALAEAAGSIWIVYFAIIVLVPRVFGTSTVLSGDTAPALLVGGLAVVAA